MESARWIKKSIGRSVCRKSLAEFASADANKVLTIFSGGVYVAARKRASVSECAAASRSPFKREPNEVGLV